MEMKRKDIMKNEKDNEISVAKVEVRDLSEKLFEQKQVCLEKEEALDIALGRANSLEC